MRNSITYILSGFFSSKTLLLGVLIFAALFLPFYTAQAGLGETIANAIVNVVAGSLDLLVAPIAAVVKFMAEIFGSRLRDVILYLITIPIVPPNAPVAIASGWTFTRNLVNIIFILILTFIGLATILRLQTYQLQKTLPSLIIIALLVNFSTVLVGFIVDIGNIFTSAFLSKAGGANFQNLGSFSFSGNPAANLATHIGEIIYYNIAALIYFIVILLFALRTIILWALTILSPFAFAAYILPATKKYWTQWLGQLIQWSILGIPISFSLYIAKEVLTPGNFNIPTGSPSAIASLAAPFTALILLYIGVTLSMQMAPAGAKGAIAWGQKTGLAAGGWAAREGWRNIAKGKRVEKLGANVRKWGQDKAPASGMGRLGKNILTRWGARTIGTGVELGSKEINTRIRGRDEEAIAKGEKSVGKIKGQGIKNFREAKAHLTSPLRPLRDTSQEVGWITGEIKIGNKKGIRKAIENGEINENDIIKLHKNAVDNGNEEASELLERAFPEFTFDKKDAAGNVTRSSFGLSAKDQKERMEDYSQKDIADKVLATEDMFKKGGGRRVTDINEAFVDRLIEEGNHRLIQQILEKGDPEESRTLWQYIKEKRGAQWLIAHKREDLIKWSKGTAAQNLGIDEIYYVPKEQLEKLELERKQLWGEADRIVLETEQLRRENARLQGEIKTLRVARKTATPGRLTISHPNREKIQQYEDEAKKIAERLSVSEKKLEETRKAAGKITEELKEIKEKTEPNTA